jgi:hypothetical protein
MTGRLVWELSQICNSNVDDGAERKQQNQLYILLSSYGCTPCQQLRPQDCQSLHSLLESIIILGVVFAYTVMVRVGNFVSNLAQKPCRGLSYKLECVKNSLLMN